MGIGEGKAEWARTAPDSQFRVELPRRFRISPDLNLYGHDAARLLPSRGEKRNSVVVRNVFDHLCVYLFPLPIRVNDPFPSLKGISEPR